MEARVRGRCPRLAGSASKGLMGQMPQETTGNVRCRVSGSRDHGGGAGGIELAVSTAGFGGHSVYCVIQCELRVRLPGGRIPSALRRPMAAKRLPSRDQPPAHHRPPLSTSQLLLAVRQVMPLWCKSTQITANRCGNPARWHHNARPSRATPQFRVPLFQGLRVGPVHHEAEAADEVALSSGRIYLKVKPSNTNDSQGQKAPSTTRSFRLKCMSPMPPMEPGGGRKHETDGCAQTQPLSPRTPSDPGYTWPGRPGGS